MMSANRKNIGNLKCKFKDRVRYDYIIISIDLQRF